MQEQMTLDKIHPSPDNPRRKVGDLKELVASIKNAGVIEPVVVTPNADGFEIVAGHRRYEAAKKAGLTEVPVRVMEFENPTQAQEARLIENLQRVDLTPMEEAHAFQSLIGLGIKQRDLATRIGRSQSHVAKRLALLDLPEEVQAVVDSGGITVEAAQTLTKLKHHPERLAKVAELQHNPLATSQLYAEEVEEELRDIKATEAYEAEVAIAKAGKYTFIASPKSRGYMGPTAPKGCKFLNSAGGSYTHLGIETSKHAKKDCHAVTVVRGGSYGVRDPKIVGICTQPKNHETAAAKSTKGQPTPEQIQKRKDHEEFLEKADTERMALVTKLCKKPPADIVEFLVWGNLVRGYVSDREVAQVFGITAAWDWDAASYALANPQMQTKLATAAVLLGCEDLVAEHGYQGEAVKHYLSYLEKHGYEISPAERLELDGKAPR